MRRLVSFSLAAVGAVALIAPTTLLSARPPAVQFGGSHASLDVLQQYLVRDWVARFNQVTAQQLEPAGVCRRRHAVLRQDDVHARGADEHWPRPVGSGVVNQGVRRT